MPKELLQKKSSPQYMEKNVQTEAKNSIILFSRIISFLTYLLARKPPPAGAYTYNRLLRCSVYIFLFFLRIENKK